MLNALLSYIQFVFVIRESLLTGDVVLPYSQDEEISPIESPGTSLMDADITL